MPTEGSSWFTVTGLAAGGPVAVAVESTAGRGDPVPTCRTGLLSTAERRRCSAMAPHRAAEFAHGRSLLRRLASAALGVPPKRLAIEVEPGGRPRLSGHRAGVSLSHTAQWTAAAVWPDGDVGVDVQAPPERVDPRLLRRCCQVGAAAIADLPEDQQAAVFARVWSVQEACVKAQGSGLAGRPWRIPVDPAAERGRWGAVRWRACTALASVALAPVALAPVALAVAVLPLEPSSPPVRAATPAWASEEER